MILCDFDIVMLFDVRMIMGMGKIYLIFEIYGSLNSSIINFFGI